MAKKKVKEPIEYAKHYTIRNEIYLFIGEKYYRRLQPIPYKYEVDVIKLKKYFC